MAVVVVHPSFKCFFCNLSLRHHFHRSLFPPDNPSLSFYHTVLVIIPPGVGGEDHQQALFLLFMQLIKIHSSSRLTQIRPVKRFRSSISSFSLCPRNKLLLPGKLVLSLSVFTLASVRTDELGKILNF